MASELDLLREGEGVLDFDAEILDSALDLGMPKEELDGAQVANAFVDLRCLGAPQRV